MSIPENHPHTRPALHQLAAACALMLATTHQAGAQQTTATPTLQAEASATLPAIEIKGDAARDAAAAYSTTTLAAQDIHDARVTRPEDLLRQVPGVSVQDYQLSGVANAIVMRGFGSGGHGGDVGVVLDGIALNEAMSHADGYADLNVIVPLELQRLTAHKGPVSALYGNFNRAGLLAFETRKGGEYKEIDTSIARHGTLDVQAALGLAPREGQALNLAFQHHRSNGFRTLSHMHRTTLAARWSLAVTPDLEIALSGRLHEGRGDAPGYVSAARFAVDPYGKEPLITRDGSKKNFATLRADVQYAINPQIRWLGFAYTTRQDFTRWSSSPASPTQWRQSESTYDRTVYGAGTSLGGHHATAFTPLNWTAGIEAFRESTDYQSFSGLDKRARTGLPGHDRRTRLNSVSAFAELDMPVHPLFQPSLGLRWDRFTGNCRPLGPETSNTACGPLARMSHASPKVGVRSQLAPGLLARASWAEGFALPNAFAKYSLGASALDPNVFRQTEVGLQWQPVAGLVLDVAAYRLLSSGEIRTVAPDVYENYGATRRTGVEASALWAATRRLDLSLAWGSAHSRVTQNANPAMVGKQVAGVPHTTTTLSAAWRPVAGWEGTLTWRRVGRYAVNADNSVGHGGYAVWDAGLSYTPPGSEHRFYASVANLSDKVYATSSYVMGGIQVFSPGAPRTLRVGVQARF